MVENTGHLQDQEEERAKFMEDAKAMIKEIVNEEFEVWQEKEEEVRKKRDGYFLPSPVAVRETITVVIDCKMESCPDLNSLAGFMKTQFAFSGLKLVVHYLRDGGDQRRPRPIPPSFCDL